MRAALSRRLSWPWCAGAALAFIGDLFLHLPVTNLSDGFVARFGFLNYNHFLTQASVAAALLVVGGAAVYGRVPPVARLLAVFLVALAVAAQYLLLVASIENVHYPQYALLCYLLGRGGMPVEMSWLTATVLGVVDEAHQYLFLKDITPSYLDWNDITLNAIGAGFGVVALLLHRHRTQTRLCTPRVAAAIATPMVAAALCFQPPNWTPFFRVTPMGIRYHVLSAGEGLVLIALMWMAVRYVLRRCQQS